MIQKLHLLNEKPMNSKIIILVITFLLGLVLVYICCTDTYDIYEFFGYNECLNDVCKLHISVPYEKVGIIRKNSLAEVNDSCIELEGIEYGSYENVNGVITQEIILTTSLENEEVYTLRIKYNEQRIIKKIRNIWEEK